MFDILRESTVGELLNRVSGGLILPYPDQRPDFVVPESYLATSSSTSAPITRVTTTQTLADKASVISGATATATRTNVAVEKVDTVQSDGTLEAGPPFVESVMDKSVNTKGFQLVDWYGDSDPENPRNSSFVKRSFVMFEISLLTCVFSHFKRIVFESN